MPAVLDQAAGLRELAARGRPSPVVACTRCHGDTGARTVWESLGIALGSSGRRTLLLPVAYDSFWRGGAEAPAGAPEPVKGLYDFSRLNSPLRPAGGELQEVFSGTHRLAAGMDLVLAECGYGSSSRALPLLELAPAVLLVFTCGSTSVLSSYELIKRVTGGRRAAGGKAPLWLLLANKAPSAAEGREALARLSETAAGFLGASCAALGALPYDPKVMEARQAGLPVPVMFPRSRFAEGAAAAAGRLMEEICRIR